MPHRTVRENIRTVPELLGWERQPIDARVAELVEMLGLDEALLDRYPAGLSGGQRQRVGVARALAADPPVMLMDEPFGAVDPIVRERLQDEFLSIQREIRKTIVLVTHDIDEATKMADRIAILNVGGVVEQFDTPDEILRRPANAFVSAFIGEERGLRRLSLLKVGDIELETADPNSAGPEVTPQNTLRFVLDAIVTTGSDHAVVRSSEGEMLGHLSLERITREVGD
jgi:osmoprotectant transport system ATP-binding protein